MSTPSQNVKELQEKLAGQAIAGKKFGTFAGVFTSTLLTILGVIMHLREGWIIGNAGLFGAWLVILVAWSITACTGLAMSSTTTNIRIGAGGAISIISQSLGLGNGGGSFPDRSKQVSRGSGSGPCSPCSFPPRVELARIPKDTRLHAVHGDFPGYASHAPPADMNIFGMPGALDFDAVRGPVEKTRSTCIFLLASGEESALA